MIRMMGGMWIWLVIAAAPAWGQSVLLMRADTLREEPYTDAAAVAPAAAGDNVRIVEQKGAWFKVEAAGKRGWVRALNLKTLGATPMRAEGVAALQTGREARGGVVVPLAVRGLKPLGPAGQVLRQVFDARGQQQTVRVSAMQVEGAPMIRVDANRSGFLYLFIASDTGDAIQCLYPNAAQPDNDYRAGHSVSIPGSGSLLAGAMITKGARDSRGGVKLLALVSAKPVDLLLPDKEMEGGLFRVTVHPASRGELVRALSSGCTETSCSGYDAAMIDVPSRN